MKGPRRFWLHDNGTIALKPPTENHMDWLELVQVSELEKLEAENKYLKKLIANPRYVENPKRRKKTLTK